MPSALLLPVLTCAAVLLVSGVAKLRDPASVDAGFTSLQVPKALDTAWVRRLVPWVEVALAAGLLLGTGAALVVVAVLTLLLFGAYLVLVALAVRRPEPVDCGCFGALGDSRVTRVTLWRNALLVLAAALAVVAGVRGVGVLASLAEGGVLAWLAATALSVATALLVAHRGDTRVGSEVASAGHGTGADDGEEYVRGEIPLLTFLDEDSELLSLEEQVPGGAHLLVFLTPHCISCLQLVPLVPEWAARLGPVRVRAVLVAAPSVVSGEALAPVRGHAWFDPFGTARRQLAVGAPGAVLVGSDGRLAGGPVSGQGDVVEFVEDVITQLTEEGVLAPASASVVSGEVVEVTDAR